MTHYVYTYWRDGEPLYVGCTNNLRRRVREHRQYGAGYSTNATFLSWDTYETREAGLAAELCTIVQLRPRHNLRHHPEGSLPQRGKPECVEAWAEGRKCSHQEAVA